MSNLDHQGAAVWGRSITPHVGITKAPPLTPAARRRRRLAERASRIRDELRAKIDVNLAERYTPPRIKT